MQLEGLQDELIARAFRGVAPSTVCAAVCSLAQLPALSSSSSIKGGGRRGAAPSSLSATSAAAVPTGGATATAAQQHQPAQGGLKQSLVSAASRALRPQLGALAAQDFAVLCTTLLQAGCQVCTLTDSTSLLSQPGVDWA